jgi:Domain of unknown function (DUF4838)
MVRIAGLLCVISLAGAAPIVCALPVQSDGNVFPDPGFEQTGTPGVAHSGERAGHLTIGAKQHWLTLGGPVTVEPFARYRVSAWARAKVGEGNVLALYCYEWNSYEWAFVTSVPLSTGGEWKRVETTFVSPYGRMVVHPLAFLDAASCEAWVDDVVVEKVAEPEATMAEMMAKANPTRDEVQVIARYLTGRGDLDRAHAHAEKADALTRADIACLLAQKTDDLGARKPLVVEMLRAGGLGYNDGTKRFGEMTRGMSDGERLALCAEAARAEPSSASAARGYRTIAQGLLGSLKSGRTCADTEAGVGAVSASLNGLLAALSADSVARKEVATVTDDVAKARGALAERRASLGKCTIKVGGKVVAPGTHAIVVPDEATPQEDRAARDLQYHLELVTGKAIPVVAESDLGRKTPIIVGKCKLLQQLGFTVDADALGAEGIFIGTSGPALALVGNKRGVLYATYTFLEDQVGCRWFAPDCSTWPREGTITVPALNRTYIPPLEYRTTDYPNSRDADWAVRSKNNGTGTSVDEARGGKVTYSHFVHTFNSLIPPEEYFDKHPEYFSEINGKRQREYTQLCLTNPEVIELGKRRVREWIAEAPDATIFSVSQNDWHNYCQCEQCTKLAQEEGSQSGPLLHFVNAIADDIAKGYPNVIIDTLAYQYTRKPPLHVKPSPNVAVRLCSIECCFIHPLQSCPENRSFVRDIQGWARICSRLHIWDYVINYAHTIMPFPNLYVLRPNINFLIRNGVTGIYEEACYYTKGAELAELRTYVMAKTLWDPKYDTDRAIDEFVAAYYGPAGRYVRDYVNLVQKSAQSNPAMHVRIYSPPGVGYLTPEVIDESKRLLDQAQEAVKGDPVRLHRVEVARLPIIYSEIALAQSPAYTEEGDQLVKKSRTDVSALAAEFGRIARAEGLTMVREGGPTASLDAWLASVPRASEGLRIERLRNAGIEVSVLPGLGGRVWRMRLLPSGRDLVKLYGEPGAWDPAQGGLEEYSQKDYRSAGWGDAYKVTAKAERAVTLEATLSNGLKLTRSFELHPAKALLSVTSTLSNPSAEAKTACLRIHPAFQVETTQEALVRTLRGDGSWAETPLADAKEPAAEHNVWLEGADVPAGQWTLIDRKASLALRMTFVRDEVGKALLNWSGKEGRVNLELFAPEVQLAPGGSQTVHQTYEVFDIQRGGQAP